MSGLHAVSFPFAFDPATRGLQQTTDLEHYASEAIRQVLLTRAGERPHRPDLGAGLQPFVFAPWTEASPAFLRTVVQDNLTRWLGHLLVVIDVVVTHGDSSVHVQVRYRLRTSPGPGRDATVDVSVLT